MKVFLASVIAFVVITVGAWALLTIVDMSSQNIYTSSRGSVRL
jgi:hypothetical protein